MVRRAVPDDAVEVTRLRRLMFEAMGVNGDPRWRRRAWPPPSWTPCWPLPEPLASTTWISTPPRRAARSTTPWFRGAAGEPSAAPGPHIHHVTTSPQHTEVVSPISYG